jgi:DNA-binding GntR family transcriptional regulator
VVPTPDNFVIDRNSFEPPYKQLGDHLRKGIATGVYRVGQRLPSESELCQRYGVSRMTARRAIGELVSRGLAERRQGRGVYACPVGLSHAVFSFDGLKDLLDHPLAHDVLLESTPMRADERVATELETRKGTKVVFIRQVMQLGNEPVLYRTAYTLASVAPEDAERGIGRLSGLLADQAESPFTGGIIELGVHVLSDEEAQILRQPVGSPAWRIEEQLYGADKTALSWGFVIIPGHLLRFPTGIGDLVPEGILNRG